MGRYVQRISLVPLRNEEVWVGWELEGVEGEVPGLIGIEAITQELRERLHSIEFQLIPAEYLEDFQGSLA